MVWEERKRTKQKHFHGLRSLLLRACLLLNLLVDRVGDALSFLLCEHARLAVLWALVGRGREDGGEGVVIATDGGHGGWWWWETETEVMVVGDKDGGGGGRETKTEEGREAPGMATASACWRDNRRRI